MALAMLIVAGTASASRDQPTIMQDDSLALNDDPTVRDKALDDWKALGVDIVKFNVRWRRLAPSADAEDKPAVDLTDPASYSQPDFQKLDAAIQGAQSRGMRVMLMVVGPAPAWAAGKDSKRAAPGTQKPEPEEFKLFAQAAGTRYSGNYQGLPRVDIWSIWNEPNLFAWLGPTYRSRIPYAAHLYRDLLYAGSEGLTAAGHTDGELLYGELAPFAGISTGKTKIRPLAFLREMACVDSRYRPYKGSAAKKRGCDDFEKLPGTGLAYHPYTRAGGPGIKSAHKDDATIGELSRITSTLDKITKAKRFESSAKQPIWSTEFGFQTDPPDPVQSPIKEVPLFMGMSEWLAWKNKRVVAYSQYPFSDDAAGTPPNFSGFQSGLQFESGRKKPYVFTAFEYPFFVHLRSASSVEVFGAVRAAGPDAQVVVESRTGRAKYKPVPGGELTTGDQGYFRAILKISGAEKRDFRFITGDAKSNVIRPVD
jgi:hypothetical protein